MTEVSVKSEFALFKITCRIIAADAEVLRNIGPGFGEVIYQLALALEV